MESSSVCVCVCGGRGEGGGGCTVFDVDIPLYVTSMSLGPPLFKCIIYHGEPI